ncbi:glycosyltransferase [Mycobacterium sp. URHD0025]|uniref:glycosyltransferase n=1 Tax=Mycobacterium sp. URHD0025 TaxID=1298864 RepID=UPI000424D434|nr:glycosyltransferase [Mycobacterium sp. URHD0025]
MTTIVIAAFGSRGDVAPYTSLARRLTAEGYRVVVAAQAPYRELVSAAGFEFSSLPGDTEQATKASPAAQAFVDGARMRPSRELLDEMRADLRRLGHGLIEAAKDADLLLLPSVAAVLGYHVAEGLGIPSVGVLLQPTAPTGDFLPSVLSARSLGRWGNRMVGRLGAFGEKPHLPLINELRAELGLRATTFGEYQARRAATWPVLHGFSEHVVPRPTDWPAHLEVTGYWWPAEPDNWSPPSQLTDFLEAGPAPIFIGLGSTATAQGPKLSDIISTALRATGTRAVVQTGWAGLHCAGDDVMMVDEIPHSWLFPRVAAVVHHCGAGTTAATLRAGVPSIPVTGIMDQPFWAKRLRLLGAAPIALRRATLTADDLAAAIREASGNPAYRGQAQRLSSLLAREDGAETATHRITELLNRSQEVHHGK